MCIRFLNCCRVLSVFLFSLHCSMRNPQQIFHLVLLMVRMQTLPNGHRLWLWLNAVQMLIKGNFVAVVF
ncbi:Uncharacterised protein [Vibrio cholerae]|nr:Uncharacterised protein [Vibrio cholerae]